MTSLRISLALFTLSSITAAQSPSTLARVRARGALLCGIDRSEAEYSSTDEHGARIDFDRDLCKAVAVAVLGAKARIVFTFYADDQTSITALSSGKADLIASLSISPENTNISFSPPVLYDATGLMVARASGITTPLQLSGKKICFLSETNTEDHLKQYFTQHHADLLPFPFQEEGEQDAAFVTNNCTGLAGDSTRLAQTRISAGAHAADYIILPQPLGPDTLAIACRRDDPLWKLIIDTTRNLLVAAEENSITSAGVSTPDASRFLQTFEAPGQLHQGWDADVLQAVGNYAELFRRDLGSDSPMALSRGSNALVRNGGLLRVDPSKP